MYTYITYFRINRQCIDIVINHNTTIYPNNIFLILRNIELFQIVFIQSVFKETFFSDRVRLLRNTMGHFRLPSVLLTLWPVITEPVLRFQGIQ